MIDAWEVERLAAEFWPAAIVQRGGGFLLRATPAFDRARNNSALPLRGERHDVSVLESFYAEHGLPPAVQVAPAAELSGLDAQLASWARRVEVDVLVAQRSRAVAIADPAGIEVRETWDDEWLDAWRAAEGRDDVEAHVEHVFPRIAHRTAFALDSAGAGVGMAVAGEGWGAIFSMATRPEGRRQGVAARLLAALVAWAPADRLFLQVSPDNAPAQALYARAGFGRAYGYHFRVRQRFGAHALSSPR